MKIFIQVLCFCFFSLKVMGDIVLVPDPYIDYSAYQIICSKNGYACFPQAYAQLRDQNEAQFLSLVNDFNLDDPAYVKNFLARTNTILKTENISADQLEQMIMIFEKLISYQKRDYSLKTHLKNLKTMRQKLSEFTLAPARHSESLIFIFDLSIEFSEQNLRLLKLYFNNVNYEIVHYNRLQTGKNNASVFFLEGECTSPQYNIDLEKNSSFKQIPLFKKPCHFDEQISWGTDLIGYHFSQNKKKYYWGLGLLLGFIVYQNHDVILEY